MLEGLVEAFRLLASGNPEVVEVTLRSLGVSGSATLLAASFSIPLSLAIALKNFKGKPALIGFFNALIGMPTVALGLILYLLFSKAGPLGPLHLLYNPVGIMLGQAILITPLIVSFTTSALEAVDPDVRLLARTLGASHLQEAVAVVREASSGIMLAVAASFNRAVAELGIALMVGGNIKGLTRVLTTAIALETVRGEIELGIALTVILLLIVFALNLAVNLFKRRLG
ncbi:MAG: ABC tungstate transporter substrate-binding protein [Candidatus Hecatellales archaeon B24]|nr:MAG: ABC tungstate transporter substrate-binding protein [Candidatus Hecatellales archaeon B24]